MFDLKIIRTEKDEAPENYLITDEGLKKAVNMAIWLQKPLLLTGNPGTGKTRLADKVAFELHQLTTGNKGIFLTFLKKPFVFNTKTTSSSHDLFYYYDAIGHYRESAIKNKDYKDNEDSRLIATCRHIQLKALGWAILRTYGRKKILADPNLEYLQYLANFNDTYKNEKGEITSLLEDEPGSSVVLIDEIDKASRDFPNDLLNEIEKMEFFISELNKHIPRSEDRNTCIVVIMTSNFEKNLPGAFLRRCLFFHIQAPGTEKLIEIVKSRMNPYVEEMYKKNGKSKETDNYSVFLNDLQNKYEPVIVKFKRICEETTDKTPATAELLEWIKVLIQEGFFEESVDFENLSDRQREVLHYSFPILVKSTDDLKKILEEYPLPAKKSIQ